MKKFLWLAGAAVAMVGAAPAYADVTCSPSVCTAPLGTTATFDVSPSGVGPGFKGPISAAIAVNNIAASNFTDTFNFTLPYNGVGQGVVTSITSFFADLNNTMTDIDFSQIKVNGNVIASVGNGITNGFLDLASASNIALGAGPNQLQILGRSYGNGSYGGALSFTPAVPELATWGMMILGFAAAGSALRYRRRSTKVSFA